LNFLRMKMQVDIKSNLAKYLPSAFALLGKNSIDWNKITANYNAVLIERKKRMNDLNVKTIQREACIFDIITEAFYNKSFPHYALLDFFNSIFFELSKITTKTEKNLIKNTLYHVLISTDKNYLNFIGEFAVLWMLKKAGFMLFDVEHPLNEFVINSKRIDFVMTKDNKVYGIEVVNIHLPDAESLLSKEAIERVLQKIRDKLKTKNHASTKLFYLIPVLWGEFEAIKLVMQYLHENEITFVNTLEPVAYLSFTRSDNKTIKYRFGKIKIDQ
jgi:hypothetical protein